jgi:L-fuculose-phosphate aldolase
LHHAAVADTLPSMTDTAFRLRAIGRVRSTLQRLEDAARQGSEGAPRALLEIDAPFRAGLDGLQPGDEVIVLTWFHLARRDVLKLHPRNDPQLAIAGVFSTRSPDRPNPIGLHRVRVVSIDAETPRTPSQLEVEPLEAIDGTPIIDLKPVWKSADH